MELVRLLYGSNVSQALTLDIVRSIVETAEHRNRSLSITGFLCFDSAHFLQALEGEPRAVNELYHRIVRDPRHKNLFLLGYGRVSQRAFPEWAMGDADVRFLSDHDRAELLPASGFDPEQMSADQGLNLLLALERLRRSARERHGL